MHRVQVSLHQLIKREEGGVNKINFQSMTLLSDTGSSAGIRLETRECPGFISGAEQSPDVTVRSQAYRLGARGSTTNLFWRK